MQIPALQLRISAAIHAASCPILLAHHGEESLSHLLTLHLGLGSGDIPLSARSNLLILATLLDRRLVRLLLQATIILVMVRGLLGRAAALLSNCRTP